jgi:hypothetical protein
VTGLFNKTASLTLVNETVGTDGSPKEGNAIFTTTGVPCSLQPDSSAEAMQYMRETGRGLFTLFLPYSWGGSALSVSIRTRVTVGGTVYEVRGPARDMAGRGRFLVLSVEVVT